MSIQSHYNRVLNVYGSVDQVAYPHGKTWSLLSTVEGLKDLLSSREIIRDEGGKVLADYKIYLDKTDIVEADIIEIDTQWFDIYSIHNPNELDRHLELKVKLLSGDPR